MIGLSNLTDLREELYVSLFRRWLIVKQLGHNKTGDNILSVQKGALFDYLLKNPKDMHSFLVSFNRLNQNSPYIDILYSNDAEYGSYQDTTSFLQSMLILEAESFIKIQVIGSECFVTPGERSFDTSTDLAEDWKLNLSLLKPLVGKSLNILQKNSLG